ncbi:MFS transporter [Halobacillus andaensis]|uniref:MFS transporter n=1 Tax=Halobacillus andaensis TaxID=1176239 RepID=A0A917B6R2_HALAA|nr:MFS transporter [Halobacillus andaensis]MBP2005785.1 YNFM family putative membrane transporter [Halobacillus andaensis]GGF26071.1 MFS transporter [Halobacillus andaensis]
MKDFGGKKEKPYTPKEPAFWRVTIALMLASLLVFSTLYVFQPLLPVFVDEFQVTATQSSLLVSSAVISMVVGLFILGFMADRYGRLLLMHVSLGMTVLLLFAMPFTPSFEALVGLRLLQGFFLAGVPAAAMGYLGEEVSPQHLGLAVTLYISSNALGGMGGRVVAGYLTDVLDWNTTLLFMSGFGIVSAGLFILLLPKERFYVKQNTPLRKDLQGMLVHLKDTHMLVLFLMGLLLQIVFTAVWTYLPFYLQAEPFNWPLTWISFTYFAYGFGVLAPPLAGRLSVKIGLPKVMIAGLFVLLTGVWMTALPMPPVILIGLGVICMGFFVAHSMAAALVSKTASHHRSGASGFYLISYYIGVAIGSTAIGALWEQFMWWGIIATSLVFIVVIAFIPMYKKMT